MVSTGMAFLAVGVLANAMGAGPFYVNGRPVEGPRDGQTWATAFSSVQEGIDAAREAGGGEVWVAAGLYTSAGSRVALVASQVQLYGGFAGTETTPDERAWSKHVTILDGEETRGGLSVNPGACVDGFVIRSCRARYGAGVYAGSAALGLENPLSTLANCLFIGNQAEMSGGALFASSSTRIRVENCLFIENRSMTAGAVRSANYSRLHAVNCTFYGNIVTEYDNGVLWVEHDAEPATIVNCIFWNDAEHQILNSSPNPLTMRCCNVRGGYAGNGNLDCEPGFMNAAAGDFRLRADSPCIDAGDPAAAPPRDYNGVLRPEGSGVDIGAYEYTSTPGEEVGEIEWPEPDTLENEGMLLAGVLAGLRGAAVDWETCDLDGDGVFDSWTVALAGFLLQDPALGFGLEARAAYALNLAALTAEPAAAADIDEVARVLAVLLMSGDAMQRVLAQTFSLSGSYAELSNDAKAGECVLCGSGDLDSDGALNREEFRLVCGWEGTRLDYIHAAMDPEWNGASLMPAAAMPGLALLIVIAAAWGVRTVARRR